MNKPLKYFNDMVECNQLDYGKESKKVNLIRDALTEKVELEDTVRKALYESYLLRVLLWQILGAADLTLEKPEIGEEAIHVQLHDCEFFWTGPGVYWLKENYFKLKPSKEE
jgi:hypothetical protein